MGVDSRLALEIFSRVVGSHVWRFRGRFAFVKMQEKLFVQLQLVVLDEGNEWQSHL